VSLLVHGIMTTYLKTTTTLRRLINTRRNTRNTINTRPMTSIDTSSSMEIPQVMWEIPPLWVMLWETRRCSERDTDRKTTTDNVIDTDHGGTTHLQPAPAR